MVRLAIVLGLLGIFFVYAGDPPPGVNEAHYLVKAKNFWDPSYLAGDLFASSSKAHVVFDVLWGWPTIWFSLETTAWVGRFAGWLILAIGMIRLTTAVVGAAWPALLVTMLWIVGMQYGNLAGEWVVGGIEAKVPAYGLVLFGLAEVVVGRWNRAWIWMGAASAMHVLTGGWSVVATMIAWSISRSRGEISEPFFTKGLFIGGAIAMLGVVPAALMNQDGSGLGSTASMIYVYDRIPHHLLPANFYASWYARHSLILAGCVWVMRSWTTRDDRSERIRSMILGVMAIPILGMLLGMLPAIAPEIAASLLRFYWFRISDALLPLFLSSAIVHIAVHRVKPRDDGIQRRIAVTLIVVGVSAFAYASLDRIAGRVPVSVQNRLLGWQTDAGSEEMTQTWNDWRAVCRWAEQSTPPETMFLTPRHQQTFKWYSSRPEVVNWKDVPQDAAALVEWKRRMGEVYPVWHWATSK